MKLASLYLVFLCAVSYCQEWQLDFETAKNRASEENKPIILVFQGSDWCAPCIKLDKEIWKSEEFIEYASEYYIMLQADFPRKKKNKLSPIKQSKNNKLAEAYNEDGIFPLVVVLDAQGKTLGKTSYLKSTPSQYIAHINSFLALKE